MKCKYVQITRIDRKRDINNERYGSDPVCLALILTFTIMCGKRQRNGSQKTFRFRLDLALFNPYIYIHIHIHIYIVRFECVPYIIPNSGQGLTINPRRGNKSSFAITGRSEPPERLRLVGGHLNGIRVIAGKN